MTPLLTALLFSILISVSTILLLRWRSVQYICALLLPLVLLPLWIKNNPGLDLFIWVKSYSVFASLAIILLSHRLSKTSSHTLLSIFLGGNILEAIVRNVQSQFYLNATTGLLLLIPLVFRWWESKTDTKNEIVEYGLTPLWIWAYTIWNMVFILTEFPYGVTALSITLLLPLFISIKNPLHWLHWRAVAFSLYFIERLSVPKFHESMFITLQSNATLGICTVLGFVLSLLMLTEEFIRPHFSQQPRVNRPQTS